MKRVLISLLALLLCCSMLFITSCSSCNSNKDDETNPQTPVNDPIENDPAHKEKHEKYPKTMEIVDLVNSLVASIKTVEMPEMPEIALPTVAVDNLSANLGGVSEIPEGFTGAYFNGKNTVYIPIEGVDYEYAGMYLVLEGTTIYMVTCTSKDDVTVQAIDMIPAGGAGMPQIPGLDGSFDISSVEDMSQILALIPDDISTIIPDEYLAMAENLIKDFPAFSDEYKDDLGNGKYRIDKKYFKDLLAYVLNTVAGLNGSTLPQEVLDQYTAIIDILTLNIDITETNGKFTGLDFEFAYPNMGSAKIHAGLDGATIDIDVNIPDTVVGSLDITANPTSFSLVCKADVAGMANIDVNLSGEGENANADIKVTVAEMADISITAEANATKVSATIDANVTGVADIIGTYEATFSEGMPQTLGYTVKGTINTTEDVYDEYGVITGTTTTNVNMDVAYKLDLTKINVAGENVLAAAADITVTEDGIPHAIDMEIYIKSNGNNSFTASASGNVPDVNASVSVEASCDIKIGGEVNVPDIASQFNLKELAESFGVNPQY